MTTQGQAREAAVEVWERASMVELGRGPEKAECMADAASDVWKAALRELLRHDPYKVGTTVGCRTCGVMWPCAERQRLIAEVLECE